MVAELVDRPFNGVADAVPLSVETRRSATPRALLAPRGGLVVLDRDSGLDPTTGE
jgi:hypothetical protein